MNNVLEIAGLIANIMTCIGVMIAVVEFYKTKKLQYILNEREIKQNTLSIYREYEHKFHTYNNIIYKKCRKNSITYTELKEDLELEKMVCDYLNELEFICTGVNIGIYDINVLERLYGNVIVRLFEQVYEYIDFRRKDKNSNIEFLEFEIVAKKMKCIQGRLKNLNSEAEFKMNI